MTFLYITILFLATVVVIGSTVYCAMILTAPKTEDATAIARLEKTGAKVADAYKKIENGTVATYKKIEDGVVGTYKKVEDGFVDQFLTHDGETVDKAKKRLRREC